MTPKALRETSEHELGRSLLVAARNERPEAHALERTLAALSVGAIGAAGALAAGKALAASSAAQATTGAAGLSAAGVGAAGLGTASLGTAGVGTAVAQGGVALTLAKWFGVTAALGAVAVGGERALHWASAPSSAPAPSALVSGIAVGDPGRGAADSTAPQGVATTQSAEVTQGVATTQNADGSAALAQGSNVPAAPQSGSAALALLNNASARSGVATQGATPSSALVQRSAVAVQGSQAQGLQARNATPSAAEAAFPAPSGASAGVGAALPTEPAVSGASALPAAARPVSPAPSASAPPVNRAQHDRLAEEVRWIDAARAQLGAGDPAAALRSLSQHSRRFAAGALGPEALYLRLEAQWALGQHGAARATARHIVERFPSGPSARRAQEILDQ